MIDNIKKNGIHFTPSNLGEFLSQRILENFDINKINSLTILDPACGDGELLTSISTFLKDKVKFKLIGFDIDQNHILNTKNNLIKNHINDFELSELDYLDNGNIQDSQSLFGLDSNCNELKADIIIANPPYVRTQVLGTERSQYLSKKFQIKGRIDLYFPFLISMTNNLKNGGILGVLTSNKYFFTKSGESIRSYLLDNYEIIEIIDLGDTKFFEAAVLPAIFIGRKIDNKLSIKKLETKFTKIYEYSLNEDNTIDANSIIDILNLQADGVFKIRNKQYKQTVGKLIFPKNKNSIWSLCNKNEIDWIKKIETSSKNKICDFVKVKVGVKTTADNVFIRDDWNNIDNNKQPENILLKPLISQDNLTKWNHSDKSKLKILYPYLIVDDKKALIDINDYPQTKKYLSDFESQLKSRKYLIDAGREWYEIWVPQNPKSWQLPKIVFPDISLSPRFHFDTSGSIVNGNCYWFVSEGNIDLLFLIQGISNSKLMTKYHDLCFNNKLYSGRRRYFSQYVENYPLPDISSKYSKEIIEIAKSLNNCSNVEIIESLEQNLEIAVANAFNVDPIFILD